MKRVFDLVITFIGLLLLVPVIILVAALVRLKLGSAIFFKQARPGLNGDIFNMYKFRTMTNECDKNGVLLSDKDRLTKFGKFLRSTSLDELPGLWCVLQGDMSLVGPRPLLMRYLSRYTPEQARRHEVKPGITGWAQINGRNAISWEQKFKFDVWYVDNHTFWLDLKIIFFTVVKVLKREGISQKGVATMEEFKGLRK